ncbi:sentrin-specific protease 1-like [Chelonus insularis]|nr:sentrin-specific protease 1-like [Chelonus insularis]
MEVPCQEISKVDSQSSILPRLPSCKRSLFEAFNQEKSDQSLSPPLPQISQEELNMAVSYVVDNSEPKVTSLLDDYKDCLGPDDTLIKTKVKISIYVRDLKTLYPPTWLNDQIINVYFEMIAERGAPSIYACNTFFFQQLVRGGYTSVKSWTKKVRIFSMRMMMVPIHLGAHWCLAVVNFEDQSIIYYDSQYGKNDPCLQALLDYLCEEHLAVEKKPLDRTLWTLHHAKGIPRQFNGYDCGVFVCAYAEHISRGEPLNFSAKDMYNIRGQILDEIISNVLHFPSNTKHYRREN